MARSTSIVVIRAGLEQRAVQSNCLLGMLRHSYNPHREVRSISCSYQSGKYFVGKLVILESVETSKRMQERGRPWKVPSYAIWQPTPISIVL